MRLVTRFLLASVVLVVCAIAVQAQVTTADVIGRVTDPTGRIVANAKIALVNTGTNIERTEQTNQAGDYVFNLLPPGQYSIRIESAGFKAYKVANLLLAAGDRTRVDAQMQIGSASEAIQVTGEAAVLQTDSSSLGTSVTGKLVQDLPLNGRNYIALTQLVPGVSPGPANGLATGTRPDDRRLNSSFP